MAEKLTPQQARAVKDRGGKLLVSAAAGSGKTKVLVDRLMMYLTDDNAPANLDEFLIITYTEAAAAELRGKIAAKLTDLMSQYPENRHLQRQMQNLYLTNISTVHAFCSKLLKEYAYRLDISSDFHVADENTCRELQERAMERVLEQTYAQLDQKEEYRAFIDGQGLGRDDRLVPDIILKVYNSACCHLDPEKWLDQCIQNAQVDGITDAGQTVWGKYLMEDLFRYLDLQIDAMRNCAEKAADAGMGKQSALLYDTLTQLLFLRAGMSWDDICQRGSIDYGTLRFGKECTDEALIEGIKAVRDVCKKGVAEKLTNFYARSEQVLDDLARCATSVKGLVALVRAFTQEYQRLKRARHALDFSDLEHYTLQLLLGKQRRTPTAVAMEVGSRFREIMVDEYQDSNQVQDAIFSALTQIRQNCFMVGDVKQSIYQFRLADPTIFLDKYNTYVPAEDAEPGQGRKVMLSANFRSGGAVLDAVNDIFEVCMSPEVGGLAYTEDEALREGVPHVPLGDAEVELLALDVQESTYEEEAEMVAQQIVGLLDGKHMVRSGEELRPITPGDIAILLRSPGSVGHHYVYALERCGIKCVSSGGEEMLQTPEIATLRSLLQVICNPRQDIPLVALLASPLFGFTADDLAAFRAGHRGGSVYDALKKSDAPKVQHFLHVLQRLRKSAKQQTLSQLLENILLLTHMESIFEARCEDRDARGNLEAFFAMAVGFEGAGKRDLGQFVEFLDAMEKDGLKAVDAGSAGDAVTLTSIHKSKGLEYPVVFCCGLSKGFNRESTRAQVLCDKELGLGLAVVDEKNRLRYPSITKRAIKTKMIADSLSEEMRVLYVALTRARDRLIMTYTGKMEKVLKSLVSRMDLCDSRLLTAGVTAPGQWVLLSALRRTESGALFELGGYPRNVRVRNSPWLVRVLQPEVSMDTVAANIEQQEMPEGLLQQMQQGLSFRYAHEAATAAPSKLTATQRKGRQKDAESAEYAHNSGFSGHWRKPSFVEKAEDSTDLGTATHLCMQHIHFAGCDGEMHVARELERMQQEHLLTPEQVQMVDTGMITEFFRTELGGKLMASNEVLREFKFSVLDDGANYDPGLAGEQILLQGVVDCALIEDDGITVLDFKTDRVTEETVTQRAEQYRNQVLAYAHVLERIYEKPVKQALLYFFRLGKFVSVLQCNDN